MLKDTIIYTERLKERPITMEDFEILYENYVKMLNFIWICFQLKIEKKLWNLLNNV